jgi:hypothetical protein
LKLFRFLKRKKETIKKEEEGRNTKKKYLGWPSGCRDTGGAEFLLQWEI